MSLEALYLPLSVNDLEVSSPQNSKRIIQKSYRQGQPSNLPLLFTCMFFNVLNNPFSPLEFRCIQVYHCPHPKLCDIPTKRWSNSLE